MPAQAGYSLDQLLSWCVEDRLIDGFERRESRVVIVQGEVRHELAAGEAETFLRAAFRPRPAKREGHTLLRRGDGTLRLVTNRA